MKILSQRANEVLIKACLKHILLWTTNEWLTKLIHIFTLQTILLPYIHDNISEKVHSSKKMHFLDKVLPALGKTVVYFANFFSVLSQVISAKLSMENPQIMNSESTTEKANLISSQIIR